MEDRIAIECLGTRMGIGNVIFVPSPDYEFPVAMIDRNKARKMLAADARDQVEAEKSWEFRCDVLDGLNVERKIERIKRGQKRRPQLPMPPKPDVQKLRIGQKLAKPRKLSPDEKAGRTTDAAHAAMDAVDKAPSSKREPLPDEMVGTSRE